VDDAQGLRPAVPAGRPFAARGSGASRSLWRLLLPRPVRVRRTVPDARGPLPRLLPDRVGRPHPDLLPPRLSNRDAGSTVHRLSAGVRTALPRGAVHGPQTGLRNGQSGPPLHGPAAGLRNVLPAAHVLHVPPGIRTVLRAAAVRDLPSGLP